MKLDLSSFIKAIASLQYALLVADSDEVIHKFSRKQRNTIHAEVIWLMCMIGAECLVNFRR